MEKENASKIEDKIFKIAKQEKFLFRFFGWRKFFWVIIFIFLIVFLGAAHRLWIYFQQPAVSRLNHPTEKTSVEDKEKRFDFFEGKHFSFFLSSEYVLKKLQSEADQNKVILESAFFSEEAVDSKKIAVTIENLRDGIMQNSANYNMRAKKSRQYQKEDFQIGKIKGVAFELKNENFFEKTFFIQNGNLAAIISFTFPLAEKENLKNEIEDVIASFNWR